MARYITDRCGKVWMDAGMGFTPAKSLGVTMSQAAINQAVARVISEGTELAILPPTCPTGSQAYSASQQFFTPEPCWDGYARAATTVLRDGTRCVPPCTPTSSRANGNQFEECRTYALQQLDKSGRSDAGWKTFGDVIQLCKDNHCFPSLKPEADYRCFHQSDGTYECCE